MRTKKAPAVEKIVTTIVEGQLFNDQRLLTTFLQAITNQRAAM